jgi:hypothetical protein
MKWGPAIALTSALAIGTAACGDSPSSPSSSGGRLVVRLSASTFGSAPAVLVTFSRVRALRSGGASTDVPLPNGAAQYTCDLRRLQQNDGEIAVGALAPGDYSEVRLTVQSATLYLDNPSTMACAANFVVPSGRATPMSGTPSEVVLSRAFHVEATADTAMRIAMNSEQSIRATGGGAYTFQPVITVLSVN